MKDECTNKAASAIPQTSPSPSMGVAGRMGTKAMLLEKAEQMRHEAHQLETLAYAIEGITGEAESMLWRLLSAHIYR